MTVPTYCDQCHVEKDGKFYRLWNKEEKTWVNVCQRCRDIGRNEGTLASQPN